MAEGYSCHVDHFPRSAPTSHQMHLLASVDLKFYLVRPLCHFLPLITSLTPILTFPGSVFKSTNFVLSSFCFKEYNYISLNQQRTNKTITITFVLWNHSKTNGSNQSEEACKEHLTQQMFQLAQIWLPCTTQASVILNWPRKFSSFQGFQLCRKQYKIFEKQNENRRMVRLDSRDRSPSMCATPDAVGRCKGGQPRWLYDAESEGSDERAAFNWGVARKASLHPLLPSLTILWFRVSKERSIKLKAPQMLGRDWFWNIYLHNEPDWKIILSTAGKQLS